MKTLTKSLHTVTAATNVARIVTVHSSVALDARRLARAALDVLGYNLDDFPEEDPTVAKIVRECARILSERKHSPRIAA
jgi:hypothetical protein